MKKTGIFYSKNAVITSEAAKKIQDAFGDFRIEVVPVETAWQKDFERFDNIIAGASTWFDGELPAYWDELIPELNTLNLKGRKVAIFGIGNQADYPENFVDGIRILADAFEVAGARLVGQTSVEGYSFERSRAVVDGQFLGLVLDIESQPEKTDQRIRLWVETLKKEFQ